jgi:hypothetical protein
VANQVDWPHVAEEIEDVGRADARRPEDQQEIARLTALLAAAEARIDDLTHELADTRAELAAVRDQTTEAATARTAADPGRGEGALGSRQPARRG